MTGLNQKTTQQNTIITDKSDEIIAALNRLETNAGSGVDNTQAIVSAIQAQQNVIAETNNRIQTLIETIEQLLLVAVDSRGLITELRDDMAAHRATSATLLNAIDNNTFQTRDLLADFIAPTLEGILNNTGLTADNVLATACLCENGPALPPGFTGSGGQTDVHCQRSQAFLARLSDNIEGLLETVRQGGRITTAAATTLFVISLSGASTPITVPATIVASVLTILGNAAEFKLVQLKNFLEENEVALRQALYQSANGAAAQAAWYAIIDNLPENVLEADVRALAKLIAWSGAINELYSVNDIGQDAFDGSICAPPPAETWTRVALVQGQRYRPAGGTFPDELDYDGYTRGYYPLPPPYGFGMVTTTFPRLTGNADEAPPPPWESETFPVITAMWNRITHRIRWRVSPGANGEAEVVRHYGSVPPNTVETYAGGWIEPTENVFNNFVVQVRATATAPAEIDYQIYQNGVWQALA